MNSRLWRLIKVQVTVQLLVKMFNFNSLMLLVLQPIAFSAVGMLLSRAAGQPTPNLVYNVIGGGIMGMWSGIVFISSYEIISDRYSGMLEMIIGSPVSMETVVAIRNLTNVLTGLCAVIFAFLIAMGVFGYSLSEANIWGAGISLILLLFAMWSIGVLLSNFFAWSRVSATFVEYFEMPIAIMCGFMYPIRVLPNWMQFIAGFIPIRWALEAMNESLLGMRDLSYLLEHWAFTLALSLAAMFVTHFMQKKVQDIIRINGEISSQ